MTDLPNTSVAPEDLDALKELSGTVAVFVGEDAKLGRAARRIDRLTRGAVRRCVNDEAFGKMEPGSAVSIAYPAGMSAERLVVVRLSKRDGSVEARKGGAAVTKGAKGAVTVLTGGHRHRESIAVGCLLGAYAFRPHKTDDAPEAVTISFVSTQVDGLTEAVDAARHVAAGVYETRDLVNEPANVLGTEEFASRLKAFSKLGLKVKVLEEAQLEKLEMRTLLAVGQGSASPSKVVIMEWNGGGKEAPLALIGKGVVFDTGGISLKPAGGMEEMTMDMGGAGVVAGVMKTLALRKAKANVVGLVGLVENMPDGTAQRPGDVVRSMKGDTVEVINTDAEGRLVLCDVMWHAQEAFKPSAMIDLATLTGAVIIALGEHNAGVFCNDDALAKTLLKACDAEGEGAWRMPLGKPYAKQLKSRVADLKNVGGRPAGSVTAAEFLHRFVKDSVPWAHIDIAGVASLSKATDLGPEGATGWGVQALNRLVADQYEAE